MAAFILFLFWVASLFVTVPLGAYTGQALWEWFVVPAFHVDPISMKTALGLSMLTKFWTFQDPPDVDTKERSVGERFGLLIAKPLIFCGFTLLIAQIYRHCF